MAAIIAQYLGEHDIYLSFLKLMADAYDIAELGYELPPCVCEVQPPNISLVDTYPGSINNTPEFLYDTEGGGSVWECTYVLFSGRVGNQPVDHARGQ